MKHLKKGIYCRISVLKSALCTAKKPEHLARRLVPGVFTNEGILKATWSTRNFRGGMINPMGKNGTIGNIIETVGIAILS